MTDRPLSESNQRTIAIGDIHGCRRALTTLLAAVDIRPGDTVVLLGDIVDRGEDSAGAIECLLELRSRCRVILVRGNHEDMMLNVIEGMLPLKMWEACGGDATLQSYGGQLDNIPAAHRQWLAESVLSYEHEEHFFIHANYVADLPLSDQPESVAMWLHLSTSIPPPHCSGKTAVVGHTPQTDGTVLDLGHIVCIDTFCVGGQWLTAFDVTTGTFWQANNEGQVRETVVVARVRQGFSPDESDS